jgi:general secretion pathway protein G
VKIRYKLAQSGTTAAPSSITGSHQLASAQTPAQEQVEATRAMLPFLLTATQVYKVDMGKYPSSLDELVKSPGSENWKGPYVRVADWPPVDAWGTPIRFSLAGGTTRPSPIISSAGPDRTFDTADDLRSDR